MILMVIPPYEGGAQPWSGCWWGTEGQKRLRDMAKRQRSPACYAALRRACRFSGRIARERKQTATYLVKNSPHPLRLKRPKTQKIGNIRAYLLFAKIR